MITNKKTKLALVIISNIKIFGFGIMIKKEYISIDDIKKITLD